MSEAKNTAIGLLAALTLLFGGMAWWQSAKLEQREARIKELSHAVGQLRVTADSLARIAGKVDTLWRERIKPRWDSVRITDTVVVNNIVYVPRPAADSAIKGCSLALDACQRAGLAKDDLIATQDSLLTVLRKNTRCKFLGIPCETVALVGGFAAGVLIAK